MSTHLADLLSVLGDELDGTQAVDIADVAGCLASVHQTLQVLARDGLDGRRSSDRRDTVLTLAQACDDAARLFTGSSTARCTQLAGVAGDVVGRLRDELTQADRWSAAIGLTQIAGRCERRIREAGPYGHLAELGAVRASASAVRRVAEVDPPDPTRCLGMTRPIPGVGLPSGLTPAQVSYEALAEALDLMRRPGRPQLGVLQMTAVARAGHAVAMTVGHLEGANAMGTLERRWRGAASGLARLHDARPVADDRLMLCALRAAKAANLVRNEPELGPDEVAHVRRAARLLPSIADTLDVEVRTLRRAPLVPVGDAPLHEGRVEEFLRHRAFIAERQDLRPIAVAIRAAGRESVQCASLFDLAP